MNGFLRRVELVSADLLYQCGPPDAEQSCRTLHDAVRLKQRLVNHVLFDFRQVLLQVQAATGEIHVNAAGYRSQTTAHHFGIIWRVLLTFDDRPR